MSLRLAKFLLLISIPCIVHARDRDITVHSAAAGRELTHPLKAGEHNQDHFNHSGLLNTSTIYRAQTPRDNNYKKLPYLCTTTWQSGLKNASRIESALYSSRLFLQQLYNIIVFVIEYSANFCECQGAVYTEILQRSWRDV